MKRFFFSSAVLVLASTLFGSCAYATTGVTDWLNLGDPAYGEQLQAAINALPSTGGTIYVPAREFPQNTVVSFPANKPVRVIGAGSHASVLYFQISAGKAPYITISDDDLTPRHPDDAPVF